MLKNQILGIEIGDYTTRQVSQDAFAALRKERSPVVVACANPHSIIAAQQDDEFRCALSNATHVTADGVGVTLAARWFKGVKLSRVTGGDVFSCVMQMAAAEPSAKIRVFFLGSTENTLSRIRARFLRDYPTVELAGTLSPPFGAYDNDTDERIISAIRAAHPDILWVGMTAPKQEKWVAAHAARLNIPVIGSIGAVFDFYAGTVSRAPQFICKLGLEWLYRLLREPQRMWRRNFISTPKFIALLLHERFIDVRSLVYSRYERLYR
jgi:N-acetylglucosaminyldiphosphoundecaprenol N-acetyl-beta-D-mannosaminyltransferase